MIPGPRALVVAILAACTAPDAIAQRPPAASLEHLAALQRVLHDAAARIAPSVVTIETFGGVRRQLGPDQIAAADGVAPPKPKPKLSPQEEEDLFDALTPDELRRLFPDADVDDLGPFSLRTLDADALTELLERFQLEATRRRELFGRLRPADLEELFPDLDAGERRKLGPDDLDGLDLDDLERRLDEAPPPAADESGKPKKQPLVMPGFLQARGATTGLVLTADGWILISRFALNYNPTSILVTLADGRTFPARRAGQDTSRGIALVKIEADGLPVPELAPPAETRTGQWIAVLGRTFGRQEASVHLGIVSATERLFGRALQIDAYTSPANYGGPAVDVRGRVLGLAVPLSPSGRDAGVDWYDSGIGFASTLADIGDLLERMKAGDVLHRGWLGIGTDGKDPGPGALLQRIAKDSPAQSVGMRRGDRIESIDGVDVKNTFHLQMLVSSKLAGDPLHVVYRRGDAEPVGVTVFLAAAPITERTPQTMAEESFTLPWNEPGGDDPGGGR